MKTFGIVLFLAVYTGTAKALSCWACHNAKTNEQCLNEGKIETCNKESVCESEFRRGSFGILLRKGCKQSLACNNNNLQNPQVSSLATQCNSRAPSSVCRCCCKSDMCNKNEIECDHFKDLTKPKKSEPKLINIPALFDSSRFLDLKCSSPSHIKHGKVMCNGKEHTQSDEYVIGTTCTYSCNIGFRLSGSSKTTCKVEKGSSKPYFQSQPPTCKKNLNSCPLPKVAKDSNILIRCPDSPTLNDEYGFGSFCKFSCNKDKPENESKMTTMCQYLRDQQTNMYVMDFFPQPESTCKALEDRRTCNTIENIPNGNTKCSYSNKIGSTCMFSCSEGYQLHPLHQSTRCLDNQTWDSAKPCCLASCPPNALMDLVIALDSSSSIDESNWEMMLNFSSSLISQFNFGDDGMRVGLYRFNEVVDEENEIQLNSYPNEKSQLLETISKLKFNNSNGTLTGNALRYARSVVFTSENGDRPNAPNVLITITDGNSLDTSLTIKESELLRSQGVITYGIGIISSTAGADSNELLQVSGNQNRVLYLQKNSEAQNKLVSQLIGNSVCNHRTC